MARSRKEQKKQHKVAIVGAGVAGCAMAGALQDHGIKFVVFDKNDGPGGLWADNYPGASGIDQRAVLHITCP
jgi:cation diffusion facilitator CzcD-associated flavoprotein CzcO